MDSDVEEAIKEAKSKKRSREGHETNGRDKKRRKKRKESSSEEDEEQIAQRKEMKADALRRIELKNLMIKFPKVDIGDMEEIEKVVSSLSGHDLKCYLDNVKLKVGLTSPFETSKNMIGLTGLALQRYTQRYNYSSVV